ncbi:LamG-like jellyroll fold domain-containing protein [Streptomyces sp. NPDC058751]|uniref:LamG-like jellyroll fold domain-containing protein n=1 Tax=Streptomyces sp. NPDC058751 TaxID=3346623 RepID=UPI0036CC26EA
MLAGLSAEVLSGGAAAAAAEEEAEAREVASSTPADEAGRGKAFWEDDALPEKSAEEVASAKAVSSGGRVEVESLTNESNQVFANADGTFMLESSPVPERVRKGDGWQSIDTTLVERDDGLLVPKAAQDVALSGGGAQAPLVKITRDGKTYELGSPWALPAPKFSGSMATYESVRPDVDLVVQVRPDGFTQNLVLHTRAAAADPALKSIRFPVKTTGLSVKTSDSGSISLVDRGGHAVFSSSAALMWDSGKAPAETSSARTATVGSSGADSPVTPDPTSRTAVADIDVMEGALTVTPDQKFLTAADTAYPVVVDPPSVSATLTGWTTLWSNSSNTSFWKTSHALGVGYDAYVDNKKSKSLFQFDTRRVAGKKILRASFTGYEIWSANCTKKDISLYRTSTISSSTTWNSKVSWGSPVDTVSAAKGFSSSCPDGDVEFDATAAVAYTAKAKATTTTLGLQASESDPIAWKQFMSPTDDAATTSRKPRLSITYVTPPANAPSSVKLSDPVTSCSASTSPAVIRDTTPRMSATPSGGDGGNSILRPNFELYDGSTKLTVTQPSAWTGSGTAGTTPTPTLTSTHTYHFRARTEYRYDFNGWHYLTGPWSSYCYFKVDATAPPKPTVNSVEYPACAGTTCGASPETGSVGMTGTFKINSGATDVRRYDLWLNGVLLESKKFTVNTPTYERKVAPTKRGSNTLRVQTFDAAGNPSASNDYLFNVAKAADPIGVWKFDENTGTAAANAAGSSNGMTLTKASWNPQARLGSGLHTDGNTSAATSGPVVDTAGSFSVSAWAKLDRRDATATVATQAGSKVGAFQLYYSSAADRWIFNRYGADVATDTPVIVRAQSTRPGVIGAWTHLLAVYDRDAQQLKLYVNGRLEATTAYTTPWASNGAFEVGRFRGTGGPSSYFFGDLDQVQAWNRVVFPDELWAQTNMENPDTGHPQAALLAKWAMDESTGSTAKDSSNRGNDLQLQPGASFAAAEDPAHGNVLSMSSGATSYATSAVALDESGSFTVAGWVNLDSEQLENTASAYSPTVFSHPGAQRNAFRLWYRQEIDEQVGDWNFGAYETDVLDGPAATITSDEVNPPGNWIHVAGVYDSVNQSIKLYLAGERQGAEDGVLVNTIFQSDQPMMTGRSRRHDNGTMGNSLFGQVDDLQVYAGVLSDAEISQLATVDEPPIDIG